jgi:hypothetical protein
MRKVTKDNHKISIDPQQVLVKLKMLSLIRPNDKICTQGSVYRIMKRDDYLTGIKRWWAGEGSFVNMKAIFTLLDEACAMLVQKHVDSNRIAEALRSSLDGINALKVTYYYDQYIMILIDLKCSKIKDEIIIFFNENTN